MDITAISAATAGLTFAKNTVSGLLDAKVDINTRTKITEALTKLGDAQDTLFALRESLFQLQTENATLTKQIADLDDWRERMKPYDLTKTAGGAVVYHRAGETVAKGGHHPLPEHYVCPSCVNKREIHFLQDRRVFTGDFECPSCKATYPIKSRSGDLGFA